jgi:hypothetical protein
MNREHPPCSTCSRFIPAKTGAGHCEGFDRPAQATDQPCVLFVEQGSREARLGAKGDRELLAEFQRRDSRKARETISRASAVGRA